MPPEWDVRGQPLNALAELATAPHPVDVRYVSVVGEVEAPSDLESLQQMLEGAGAEVEEGDLGLSRNKAGLLSLVRSVLAVLLDYPDWLGSGDGAVSSASQDMSHLPWFTERIAGVEESGWVGGTTLRYAINGMDHPLRVEFIKAHHLEEAAQYPVLRRAIAEPPDLSVDDASGPVAADRARISGTVDDFLLDAGHLFIARLEDGTSARLELTASIDPDRRHFAFEQVPLHAGDNTFLVGYDADYGFAVPSPEVRVAVAGRDLRRLGYFYGAWAAAIGAAVLAGLAVWVAARRRRAGKDTPV
jgi:hypothetical protein